MHPSLTRPYLMTEPPLHTDIIHYENIPGFPVVRQNILRCLFIHVFIYFQQNLNQNALCHKFLCVFLIISMCGMCCSLPLGSQVIAVPVNSSLSWHTNRLRDNSKDAYNVSYAWKLVGVPIGHVQIKRLPH